MNKGAVSLPKLTVPMLANTSRKNTLLLCGPVPRLTHNTAPTPGTRKVSTVPGKTQFSSKKGQLFVVLTLKGQLVPNFPGHLRGCPPAQSTPSRVSQQLVINTSITQVLWFISLFTQLILHPESRHSVRSRDPGNHKAAGCDFSHRLRRWPQQEVKGVVSPVTVLPRVTEDKGCFSLPIRLTTIIWKIPLRRRC